MTLCVYNLKIANPYVRGPQHKLAKDKRSCKLTKHIRFKGEKL